MDKQIAGDEAELCTSRPCSTAFLSQKEKIPAGRAARQRCGPEQLRLCSRPQQTAKPLNQEAVCKQKYLDFLAVGGEMLC